MKTTKIFLISFFLMSLMSCSWFASDDDPDVAYKKATTGRALELPPELVIDNEDKILE